MVIEEIKFNRQIKKRIREFLKVRNLSEEEILKIINLATEECAEKLYKDFLLYSECVYNKVLKILKENYSW